MQKKILVVDDDEILCEGLAEILRDEGYAVDNTSSSRQGMNLIKKRSYDICILDYKMPEFQGTDLLEQAKEDPRCAVFFITARPFMEKILAEKHLSHRVAGILSKPFDVETLLQKIRNLLG